MSPNRPSGANLLLGLLAAVLMVWFWWPALTAEVISADFARNLALGKRLAHGHALYADTWSHQPPVFTWLTSAGLGGAGYPTLKIWAVAALAVTLLLARLQYLWLSKTRIPGVSPQLAVLLWVCLVGWLYHQLHWSPQLLALVYMGIASLDFYRLSEYRNTPALRLMGYGMAGGLLICMHYSAVWAVMGLTLVVGSYSRQRSQGLVSYLGGVAVTVVAVLTALLVAGNLTAALGQMQWSEAGYTDDVKSLGWLAAPVLVMGLMGALAFRLNPQLRTARFRRMESLLLTFTLVGVLYLVTGGRMGWADTLVLSVPLSVYAAYATLQLPRAWLRTAAVAGVLIPLALPRLVNQVPQLAQWTTRFAYLAQEETADGWGALIRGPEGQPNTVWLWGTDLREVVRAEAVPAMPYSGFRSYSGSATGRVTLERYLPEPLPHIYAQWLEEKPMWLVDEDGTLKDLLQQMPEVQRQYKVVSRGSRTVYRLENP